MAFVHIALDYTSTLIIGHVAAIVAILGGYFRLHAKMMRLVAKLTTELTKLRVEHEMLIEFMCEVTGKNRADLVTRHPEIRDDWGT